MAQHDGPSGAPGGAEEGGRDPWAPPEERVRLSKQPDAAAGHPTVTSLPGGGPSAPAPGPHSPVGPPPPAPGGPAQATGYGGHGGYGPAGYGGYGAYDPYGGYGRPGATAWAGAPLPQGTAVASMVLGIVGLVLTVTCWGSFLGIFVAPLALILGVSARRKSDRGEAGGRSYATSGFVMGIVGTVLSALFVVFLIWVITQAEDLENDPYDSGYYDARAAAPAVAAAAR